MTTLDTEIDRLLDILDRADAPAILDNVEALAEALRSARSGMADLAEQYAIGREREVKLAAALEHYSLATVVANWGMEESAPDWEVAREALGLPELTPEERRAALGEPEPFEDAEA